MNPFDDFVTAFSALLDKTPTEPQVLAEGRQLLERLIAGDTWLPAEFAQPSPVRYQQFSLYIDPADRFSVVSFVWGPGQATPIHDHTVWGLIGMLRGAETSQSYVLDAQGKPRIAGEPIQLRPGHVEAVSPRIGDIHKVSNVYDDRVSISIHVYGADIGKVHRSVYTEDGVRKPFVSGYSNAPA